MSDILKNVDPGNIYTFYHAIVVTGTSSDSMSFNTLNTVAKNKDGSVLTRVFTPPIYVQYFFGNDTLKYGEINRSG